MNVQNDSTLKALHIRVYLPRRHRWWHWKYEDAWNGQQVLFTEMSSVLSDIYPFSARQHPSYDDCLEVKREYNQNCCVLDCGTQCSQSAAHWYEQFLQVQQWTDWVCHIETHPYAVRRGSCLELYRDVNEARSGRGRGQLSRGQNCINFSAKFYILTPFSKKKQFSVDFRRDFKNFGSKRTLTRELY